jgi:acid phosphatase
MRAVVASCILVLALLAAGCGSSSTHRSSTPPKHRPTPVADPASPCAGHAATGGWKHVIWIFFENRSADETVDWTYPRDTLIPMCATLTNMSAEQHASLGNYIAATTGSAAGIQGGCPPAECPISRDSIFEQVARSGREWRSYAQSLPRNCLRSNAGDYLVRHDPAPYMTRIRRDCARWDVPIGQLAGDLKRGSLPAFATIIPGACDSGHNCRNPVANAWLRKTMGQIIASPAWTRHDVVVFVTFDEGDRTEAPSVEVNDPCPTNRTRGDCHVATWVVAPGIPAATKVTTRFDHIGMLQLTQRMLGLSPLLGPARPNVTQVGRQLHLL